MLTTRQPQVFWPGSREREWVYLFQVEIEMLAPATSETATAPAGTSSAIGIEN